MKRKFLIINKTFWVGLLFTCVFSIVLFLIINIPTIQRNLSKVLYSIFLSVCIIILIIVTLIDGLHLLAIDDNRIKIRNTFVKIKNLYWNEIMDIYVYQFNGTEKIRIPYKVNEKGVYKRRSYGRFNNGGTIGVVPKKIPTKWIFIDDGRGDNGENIFEYFVPLRKGAIIRLKYNDKIILTIKKYYQKEIVEKTIEL